MTITDPELEERLRRMFKIFNPFMLFLWRLGLGQYFNFWPQGTGQVMVLTHIGRKSGARRRTPLNFAIVEGEIYCTAGFGGISDWYRNILHNPGVEIWLPNGWWTGIAHDISDSPQRLALLRKVIAASGFAGRLAGLEVDKLSNEELDRLTQPYRLIHIQRKAACTGAGGPGELSWIWPLATFLLLPRALRRRRK